MSSIALARQVWLRLLEQKKQGAGLALAPCITPKNQMKTVSRLTIAEACYLFLCKYACFFLNSPEQFFPDSKFSQQQASASLGRKGTFTTIPAVNLYSYGYQTQVAFCLHALRNNLAEMDG